MLVRCIDNTGFEDCVNIGRVYTAVESGEQYLVSIGNHDAVYLNKTRFEVVK